MAGRDPLIVKLPYSSSSASAIKRAMQPVLPKAPQAAASETVLKHTTPAKIITHFSQSQLALALAIQKAKPETLSTIEYCEQLRDSIKTGRPISSNGLRYIDTCEFWKDQYTKIHLEKIALQDKVHRLEEAQRQLLENLHGQPDHTFRGGSRVNDRVSNEVLRKRPAPSGEEMTKCQQNDDLDFLSSEESFLRLNSYVLRIGRQRNSMEKASTNSSTLEHINALAKHISQALVLLDNALSDTCLPLKLLKTANENQRGSLLVQQLMHQVRLSYLSCFNALNELCLTIPGRAKISEIIYRMVLFFNKSLNLLHSISNLQTQHEAAQDGRRPTHKRTRTERSEYAVNKYLTNSLSSIVYSLEWKFQKPGHADLLEGMLFCVLEHTGRLISEAVFTEHVAKSDNPGNITKYDDPVTRRSIKNESRYMVQILEAALGCPRRKELIAQVLTQGKSNVNGQTHLGDLALSSALSSNLLFRAKKLLQSTLLKNAIGGSDLDTLRLLTPPIETLAPQDEVIDEVEKYESDWLVERVWGIIGWDIIA